MKIILLLLFLISCEKQIANESSNEQKDPVILGSVYNLNGDDYTLTRDESYNGYAIVFELEKDEYKEIFRLNNNLIVDEQIYSDHSVQVNSQSEIYQVSSQATITATQEYIEVCREIDFSENIVCDIFEKIK